MLNQLSFIHLKKKPVFGEAIDFLWRNREDHQLRRKRTSPWPMSNLIHLRPISVTVRYTDSSSVMNPSQSLGEKKEKKEIDRVPLVEVGESIKQVVKINLKTDKTRWHSARCASLIGPSGSSLILKTQFSKLSDWENFLLHFYNRITKDFVQEMLFPIRTQELLDELFVVTEVGNAKFCQTFVFCYRRIKTKGAKSFKNSTISILPDDDR